jgi:hypothetical protein
MLNVTGTFQNSYIIIPTNLNTNYVFTATYQGRMTVANFNGSSTIVGVDNYSSFSQQTLAFNSGTNNQVYIYFTSGTSSNGQLMLSKPMLSLGSIPAPYSKKTGDRMVMPTPKKNMLPQPDATLYNQIGTSAVNNTVQNGALAVLSYTSRDYGKGISVNVSPNKPYTFSTFLDKNGNTVNGYIEIGYTQTSHEMLSATINAGQFSTTFTPAQSTINIRFVALSSSAISNPLLYSNIQLEQGTVRTDYTPYAIQLNKLSQRMDANGKPQL